MRSFGRTVIETDEPILQEGTSPDISRIDELTNRRRALRAKSYLGPTPFDQKSNRPFCISRLFLPNS
jgi:hypothetical protein